MTILPFFAKEICETLVLLAVHGENLFREFDIDIRAHVNHIVRELLTPFNAETWASERSDLPRYAEAAPDEFLNILESDLRSSDPKILSLLKPASTELFGGGCPRTGLLWALELLAWNPDHLPLVTNFLARLSEPRIDDNWVNKPENSLKSIFRSWLPQTAANVEQRKDVLEAVAHRFPQVGWRLCVDQFDAHATIGHYNYRPRWRKDASGAGQSVTRDEMHQFASKALDIAIHWPKHNEYTLGDLVEQLQMMRDEDQEKVWDQIDAWISTGPSDESKAVLRERIRRFLFTRRGRSRGFAGKTKDHAREVQDLLLPSDPIVRYHWLFERQWVENHSRSLRTRSSIWKSTRRRSRDCVQRPFPKSGGPQDRRHSAPLRSRRSIVRNRLVNRGRRRERDKSPRGFPPSSCFRAGRTLAVAD